jgi:hypothetical protein
MYYEGGSWKDFSSEIFGAVRSGFVEAKPMIEVEIGNSLCLFDLYRMLQIDLVTGNQRSVAWIDVDGKCFFPKRFIEGGREFSDVPAQNISVEISNDAANSSSEYPKIEIQIKIGEDGNLTKRKREEVEEQGYESCSSDKVERPKKRHEQMQITPVLKTPKVANTKLLIEGVDKAYSVIKNLFVSSLDVSERDSTVTAIHQCVRSDVLDQARHQVFQKQLEITKAARGDANMVFAWYGTSSEGVSTILAHGFATPDRYPGGAAHGVGIHLSPIKSCNLSALSSDVDENGEKHVLLCRVILGRCEKIEAGSQQSYPSSKDFDTGVDDIRNPKWHIIWCASMNTHILPECVITYKPPNHVLQGQLEEPSFNSFKPTPNRFATQLLSKLGNSVPSSKYFQLKNLFNTYKEKKVTKDVFIRQLRSLVGDDRLLATIRELHNLALD